MSDLIPSHRSFLGRVLRLPLRVIPQGTHVRILFGPARGRTWIVGSGPHSNWLGLNEVRKRRIFVSKVKPDSVVYDLGANVGSYTILASVLVGSGGLVVAFEPLAENLEYLRAHLNLNRLENVHVVPCAVSERPGTVRFSATQDRVRAHVSPNGERVVQAESVDEFVRQRRARPPACLKIDVEGAEVAVLKGARGTLAANRPVVFVATHGPEEERQCRELLTEARYEVSCVPGHPEELVADPLGS